MTLTSKATTAARLLRIVPTTLVPAALAVGVMILTAPAAYAETEQQLKDNCAALGGTYFSWQATDTSTASRCCYPSLNPKVKGTTCDYYEDGNYQFSSGARTNTTPPPVGQPVQPPPGTDAPGGVMPGQGPQPVQPPPATEAPVIP